jgi:hypothetical protein
MTDQQPLTSGTHQLEWKVHTQQLLQEILNNPGTEILSAPLNIFSFILWEVGVRAAELNDPELNALMMRLTIYEVADPYSEAYDPDLVRQVTEEGQRLKLEKRTHDQE